MFTITKGEPISINIVTNKVDDYSGNKKTIIETIPWRNIKAIRKVITTTKDGSNLSNKHEIEIVDGNIYIIPEQTYNGIMEFLGESNNASSN